MGRLISRINNFYLRNVSKSLEPIPETQDPRIGLIIQKIFTWRLFNAWVNKQVNIHHGRKNIYSYSEFTMFYDLSLWQFSLLFFSNKDTVLLTPAPQWSNLVLWTINHQGCYNAYVVIPERGTSCCRPSSAYKFENQMQCNSSLKNTIY